MLIFDVYLWHEDVHHVHDHAYVIHRWLYGCLISVLLRNADFYHLFHVCCRPSIGHDTSSICLVSMVTDFMEDELVLKADCGRARCNCVSGPCVGNAGKGAADDDEDDDGSSVVELSSILQVLIVQRVCRVWLNARMLSLHRHFTTIIYGMSFYFVMFLWDIEFL